MKNKSDGSWARAGLVGAVLGGLVGFAVGLVLAPEEGKKLRRRMAYQLDNLSGQVNKLVDRMLQDEAVSEARDRGAAVVADAWAKKRKIEEDLDAAFDQAREKARQTSSSTA